MLDHETARRRLVAARVLAGLSRQELSARMVERGWGSEDVKRLEREVGKKGGAAKKEPPRLDQRAPHLAAITGLPEEWFTEPDYGELFSVAGPSRSEVEAIRVDFEQRLSEVEAALEAELAADAALAEASPQESRSSQKPVARTGTNGRHERPAGGPGER